ncbi:double-stranded RNA-binding protein 4-like [Arachis ipaensis]|uniref:double-stranded RNA-binding protein 4-like n=1 Tax=Arachis ipaensis TaxID=130454 RepID=UPI000A2B4D7F|nr:double-stranded RNA-binding protein 4-like [Arachis ipaensis]
MVMVGSRNDDDEGVQWGGVNLVFDIYTYSNLEVLLLYSLPVVFVTDMAHLYKNQLQNYAQKQNLPLPVYTSEWEGPPHAMRFKCKVTLDGQTYECPTAFSKLKDAEHAAAEVALLSLLRGGFQEIQDNSVLYKNLLQELVQKEGFSLPSYNTERSGEAHIPTFISYVEVEGKVFTGQEAKRLNNE